jgi:hypothetical protein
MTQPTAAAALRGEQRSSRQIATEPIFDSASRSVSAGRKSRQEPVRCRWVFNTEVSGSWWPAIRADGSWAAVGAMRGRGPRRCWWSRTCARARPLYGTSGACDDWAFARHLLDPARPVIYPYTIEFGREHPDDGAVSIHPQYATTERIIDWSWPDCWSRAGPAGRRATPVADTPPSDSDTSRYAAQLRHRAIQAAYPADDVGGPVWRQPHFCGSAPGSADVETDGHRDSHSVGCRRQAA